MNTIDELRAWVAECSFEDWTFEVFLDGERPCLRIVAVGACNVSGEPWTWSSRKWFLSPWMTKSEVVQTVWKAVLTAVEHEARERFKYRGVAIFGPHLDVDTLRALVAAGAEARRA